MSTEITPGRTSDYLGFDLVMADNLPRPSVLLADHGYDADKIRDGMEARNVLPVIPMRKSRKKRIGVVHSLYRLRNLVERCVKKLKIARRVATRYGKTAERFLGFIDIMSIRLWIRHLSTGPRELVLLGAENWRGPALLSPSVECRQNLCVATTRSYQLVECRRLRRAQE